MRRRVGEEMCWGGVRLAGETFVRTRTGARKRRGVPRQKSQTLKLASQEDPRPTSRRVYCFSAKLTGSQTCRY